MSVRVQTLQILALFLLLTGLPRLLSPRSYAAEPQQNYFILVGGGGEPVDKPDTIFDVTLEGASHYLSDHPEWHSEVAFDGGHSVTDGLRKKGFPNATRLGDFNRDSIKDIVQRYTDKIRNGEIKSGDQILFFIDSHGDINRNHEISHSIAVGNPNALNSVNEISNYSTTHLDEIGALSDLAANKGVKLAIVDASCHSGFSLFLANRGTCVVSATGTEEFGYSSFPKFFFKAIGSNLRGKMSIDEAFLAAREDEITPSFPMISSRAGEIINSSYYNSVSPYLVFSAKEDTLTPLLMPYVKPSSDCPGDRTQQTTPLQENSSNMQLIKNFPEIANKIPSMTADLNRAIQNYKDKQAEMIQKIRALKLPNLNIKLVYTGYSKDGTKIEQSFTDQELLAINFPEELQKIRGKLSSAKAGSLDRGILEGELAALVVEEEHVDQLLAKYPQLKDVTKTIKDIEKDTADTYALANKVAKEERKVYTQFYKAASKQLNGQPIQDDICKDFKI